jgi:hypothetical protein
LDVKQEKLHVKKQKLEFNKDKHPDNCKKSQRLAKECGASEKVFIFTSIQGIPAMALSIKASFSPAMAFKDPRRSPVTRDLSPEND